MKKNSPSKQMQKMGEEVAKAFQAGLLSETEPLTESAFNERLRVLEERLRHKGDMRIYDFADSSLEVDLQEKPILRIRVWVVTGDEIVRVIYRDGTEDTFDAGHLLMNGRGLDDLDYEYELKGDRIQEWLHFVPAENGDTISYQRARKFGGTSPWAN